MRHFEELSKEQLIDLLNGITTVLHHVAGKVGVSPQSINHLMTTSTKAGAERQALIELFDSEREMVEDFKTEMKQHVERLRWEFIGDLESFNKALQKKRDLMVASLEHPRSIAAVKNLGGYIHPTVQEISAKIAHYQKLVQTGGGSNAAPEVLEARYKNAIEKLPKLTSVLAQSYQQANEDTV